METNKHRILFVDDDLLVLKGIQRSVDELTSDWECDFASSGPRALEKLRSGHFDAVITDMLMPGMDGAQLLELISQEMPDVLRFILTGNVKDAQILRVVPLVHQMIPKPSDIEYIYSLVEKACRLRDLLSDPQLLKIITGIKTLPSVPVLYTLLTEELESQDPNPQRIGAIIAQDTAMTAKILQLVNSAFFGLAARISSPQRAVTILGLNTIRSLVLGIDVFSGYQGQHASISVDGLWLHSVMVSNLAYTIARGLKLSLAEQEEARVSGILHDIGKLLQIRIPNFFEKLSSTSPRRVTYQEEYKHFGISHAEMGGYLLGIWGLPKSIVEAVTFHHRPDYVVSKKVDLLTALHTANGLLSMWQVEKTPQFETYLDINYLQQYGLDKKLEEWSQYACRLVDEGSSTVQVS